MNKITFFTPAVFDLKHNGYTHTVMQYIDGYFAFGGKIARVWKICPDGKSYEAHLDDSGKADFRKILTTALKVISYISLLIPGLMLLAKAICRKLHPIYLTPSLGENALGKQPPPPESPNQSINLANLASIPSSPNLEHIEPPEVPPKDKGEIDENTETDNATPVRKILTLDELFAEKTHEFGIDPVNIQQVLNYLTKNENDLKDTRKNKQICLNNLERIRDLINTCSLENQKEFLIAFGECKGHCFARLHEICSNFLYDINFPPLLEEVVPFLCDKVKNDVLLSMTDKVDPRAHHVNFVNTCRLRIGREIHLKEDCIKRAELDEYNQSNNKIFFLRDYPKRKLLAFFFKEYTEDLLLQRICEEINHPLRKALREQIFGWLTNQLPDEEIEEAARNVGEDPDLYAATYTLKKYSMNTSNDLNVEGARLLAANELLLIKDQVNILNNAEEADAQDLKNAEEELEAMNRVRIAEEKSNEKLMEDYDSDERIAISIESENEANSNESDDEDDSFDF